VPNTAVLEPLTDEPAVETNYERAKRIYEARRPWIYDARFHVAARHVRHCPRFQAPPATPYGRELREVTP
jgi:hypothetical protein